MGHLLREKILEENKMRNQSRYEITIMNIGKTNKLFKDMKEIRYLSYDRIAGLEKCVFHLQSTPWM